MQYQLTKKESIEVSGPASDQAVSVYGVMF